MIDMNNTLPACRELRHNEDVIDARPFSKMSAIILVLFMAAVLLTAIFNPFIGVLAYVWLSIAVPQSNIYGGTLASLSYAAYAAVIGLLCVFGGARQIEWNRSPIIMIMLIIFVWTTITSATAINPEASWGMWNQNWRVLLMTVLMACVCCTTRQRHYLLLFVVCGSVAIIATKGAAQYALSGGASLVVGPQGGQAAETNGIARYFGIAAPLIAVLMFHARQRWIRFLCAGGLLSCILALVGTDSRGAFVALAVAGAYLSLFSRNRGKLLLAGAVAISAVVVFSSDIALDAWKDRMSTIETRDQDASYLGRVEAWQYATTLVAERPIVGGGYRSFQTDITGDRSFRRDFHSIYFEAWISGAVFIHPVVGHCIL
jgi:putative inorganic carbon (hco3(-)) transporter